MAFAGGAPEAGLSFGLILLAVMWVVLVGLNRTWQLTFGALLRTLSNLFNSLSIPIPVVGGHIGLGSVGSALKDIDNAVLAAIGVGIQNTEKGMHAVLGAMTWLLQEMADQIAGLAQDTVGALRKLEKVTIPILIAASGAPVIAQLEHLAAQLKTALLHPTTVVHKTIQVVTPGLKAIEGKVSSLEAKVAALATAGVAANPIPIIERVGAAAPAIPADIYRGIDSLWKETKRLGKVLTPAGIVGLVAGAVLATLKLPWLKCRNVDKVGRKLCGMNTKLLDDLLGGLLVIFGTFSLVEFAKYLTPVAKELTSEITHFWRADVGHAAADRQIGAPGLTHE